MTKTNWQKFDILRSQGHSIKEACAAIGVSTRAARKRAVKLESSGSGQKVPVPVSTQSDTQPQSTPAQGDFIDYNGIKLPVGTNPPISEHSIKTYTTRPVPVYQKNLNDMTEDQLAEYEDIVNEQTRDDPNA